MYDLLFLLFLEGKSMVKMSLKGDKSGAKAALKCLVGLPSKPPPKVYLYTTDEKGKHTKHSCWREATKQLQKEYPELMTPDVTQHVEPQQPSITEEQTPQTVTHTPNNTLNTTQETADQSERQTKCWGK